MKNRIISSFLCLILSTINQAQAQASTEFKYDYKVSSVASQLEEITFSANELREHLISGYKVYTKSDLFGEYKDIEVPTQVALVIDGKVEWQQDGIFSNIVFSANGETILFVNKYEQGTEYIIYRNGRVRTTNVKYLKPRKVDFFYDGHPMYQISDSGDKFLEYSWDPSGGFTNFRVCELKLGDNNCKPLTFSTKAEIEGFALVDNSKVAYISTVSDVVRSEGKVHYKSSSSLKMDQYDNLLWETTLPNEINWEYSSIRIYKDMLILITHRYLEIRDAKHGDLLWKLDIRGKNGRYESLHDAHLSEQKLIFPFADGTGFARRDLSNLQ